MPIFKNKEICFKAVLMPDFLTQIQALDTSTPKPKQPQLEPRSVRRQKARDVAKSATKKVNPSAA